MRPKIIVVGAGLAGLSAALEAGIAGAQVDVFSIVPFKRSHSVCAQGGINAAVNTMGEGDSPWQHFDDTVYGGDFLANQPPVLDMCERAPDIVYMLDRMGVPFNRTDEGLLDFRRFGGTLHHRTAYAGATTGQQIMYALDEQVRKLEVEGTVTSHVGWEVLSVIRDDEGRARGVTAQNITTMEIDVFRADAVIVAAGGIGMVYGKSTNSVINTGYLLGELYQDGVRYANPEFIQVHPTAIPGADKLRLMSEAARGEGARVWVYKDGKPWYFLEEKYPKYGNLVPRDVATREIFHVCTELRLGVDGENKVYLDVSHIPTDQLDKKLGGILEIYEKFVGDDPRKVPMQVFPGMHYTMGGLWVDYDMHTNIPGLFAAGEVEYQHHGANRLGANSLLSCIYDGKLAGPNAVDYINGLEKSYEELPESLFQNEFNRMKERNEAIYAMSGGATSENPYQIHKELGELMTRNVTVIRENAKLEKTLDKIEELKERWHNIKIIDQSRWANQAVPFTRQLWSMLVIAQTITTGALNRNESRGAHYKPEFPTRDDENWLKTTIAEWTPDGPKLTYEDVDVSLIPPRQRSYAAD